MNDLTWVDRDDGIRMGIETGCPLRYDTLFVWLLGLDDLELRNESQH